MGACCPRGHSRDRRRFGGGKVRLPGVPHLPSSLPLLSRLVERGVEVRPDGRVIGLVKIWHWCGSDPVRLHIARVDIANALLYLGHGSVPAACDRLRSQTQETELSPYGWSVSHFLRFRTFESFLGQGC
jgi:hypothetical protein